MALAVPCTLALSRKSHESQREQLLSQRHVKVGTRTPSNLAGGKLLREQRVCKPAGRWYIEWVGDTTNNREDSHEE